MQDYYCLTLLAAMATLVFSAHALAWLFLILGIVPILAYSLRLYRLSKDRVGFASVVKFYANYFPARAIGTLAGLFKSIGANHS